MPVYEYRCLNCGEYFEKLVRGGAAAPKAVCPRCQSEAVERLLSVFASKGPSPGGGSWFPRFT